jgi:hypothetical protein
MYALYRPEPCRQSLRGRAEPTMAPQPEARYQQQPALPQKTCSWPLMPEREKCRSHGLALCGHACIFLGLHPHVPEILAVAILVESIVGVIEDHRLGITIKCMLSLGHLAERGRELNQQTTMLGLGASTPARSACKAFHMLASDFWPLWPSSTNTRLRPSANAEVGTVTPPPFFSVASLLISSTITASGGKRPIAEASPSIG